MKLKISASSLLANHYLIVTSDGVKFYEAGFFRGARRFRFSEILCLLMSPTHALSFQVKEEVFSIPTNPKNPKHQAVIAALMQGLQESKVPMAPGKPA